LVELSSSAVEIGEDTLTRRRRAAERHRMSTPFRVVLIDDDPSILRLLVSILGTRGIEAIPCSTGTEGLAVLESEEWELCLLDRGLPDLDGIEICRRIKADARFDARQVIMLSGYSSLDARVEALDLGADDYITKPFHPTELLARVNASRRVVEMQQQLVDMAKQLERLSAHDDLTGIFNRRHFGATLDHAFDHSNRYQRPLSVAIIDVDRFKDINDSFGHQILSAPQRFGVRWLATALGSVQRSGICRATQSGGKPRALQSAAARRADITSLIHGLLGQIPG
jgi:PleD family two-component response regulator